MNDETRKLLKIFGVAVTDFEAEAEKLAATAAQLSPDSSHDQVAKLMKDAAELSRELNARWLEITQRVFALQERLRLASPRRPRRCSDRADRQPNQQFPDRHGAVMSIVGLAPVVGSFSDSRFVSGLVQLLIHLLREHRLDNLDAESPSPCPCLVSQIDVPILQPGRDVCVHALASGGKENLSWPRKTALALTSFAFAAWQTSRPQAA